EEQGLHNEGGEGRDEDLAGRVHGCGAAPGRLRRGAWSESWAVELTATTFVVPMVLLLDSERYVFVNASTPASRVSHFATSRCENVVPVIWIEPREVAAVAP